MLIGETNAGYTVIAAVPSAGFNDGAHVVTALAETGDAATWETHLQGKRRVYYWGHYFNVRMDHDPRREALLDMVQRAALDR